jgi:hypothetical protein
VLGMGGALAGGAEVAGAGTLAAGVEALTPATGILSKGASLAKGLAGGVGGIVGGLALDYASDKLKESGHEKLGATADIGSSALTGAGTGAMIGSIVPGVGTVIGGAVGGLVGGAYGLYKNAGTLFGGNDSKGATSGIEAATRAASPATSEYRIAGEPAVEGSKLSDKQLAVVKMSMDMGNTYPDWVMKQASSSADMVKPTPSNGVIVGGLSGSVGALKEQAPTVAGTTVIAPSNTTVNNTTNTNKIFPPTRLQDQTIDRYRYSRATY